MYGKFSVCLGCGFERGFEKFTFIKGNYYNFLFTRVYCTNILKTNMITNYRHLWLIFKLPYYNNIIIFDAGQWHVQENGDADV